MIVRRRVEVSLSLGHPSFVPSRQEQSAAWELLVELVTRTSTTPRDDVASASAALRALHDMYDIISQRIGRYGSPSPDEHTAPSPFLTIASQVSRNVMFPVLTKWESWLEGADQLSDRSIRPASNLQPSRHTAECLADINSISSSVDAFLAVVSEVGFWFDYAIDQQSVVGVEAIERARTGRTHGEPWFAARLPGDLWIWKVDPYAKGRALQTQIDHFSLFAGRTKSENRLLLWSGPPTSRLPEGASESAGDFFEAIGHLARSMFRTVPVWLTGDAHLATSDHLRQLGVVAGGSGTFLQPTPNLAERIPNERDTTPEFVLLKEWPPARDGSRHPASDGGGGAFLQPTRNLSERVHGEQGAQSRFGLSTQWPAPHESRQSTGDRVGASAELTADLSMQ
jgi:hypothetical protein